MNDLGDGRHTELSIRPKLSRRNRVNVRAFAERYRTVAGGSKGDSAKRFADRATIAVG
jgi:hypothetical protein